MSKSTNDNPKPDRALPIDIEAIRNDLANLPPKPTRSCPTCGHRMTPNGTSSDNQSWACRIDRGGCGATETEGGNKKGGQSIGSEKMSGYERLKRHREKKRREKLEKL